MTYFVDDAFESPAALLRWAHVDTRRLERSAERFFASRPFVIKREPIPGSDFISVMLALTKKPPASWRRLAFHALCDIRHAIDQAMFTATARVTGTTPEADIYFPWARSPADLRHRLKKLPPTLWPVIERLEPYPRGDDHPGGDDVVYAARNLAGPNKHRFTITPSPRPIGTSIKGTATGPFQIPYDGWNEERAEFEIVRYRSSVRPDFDAQLDFGIAFHGVDGLQGFPVVTVLDHFGSYAGYVASELSAAVETLGPKA